MQYDRLLESQCYMSVHLSVCYAVHCVAKHSSRWTE